MAKTKKKAPARKVNVHRNYFSKRSLIIYTVVFAVLGSYFVFRSFAATVVATLEVEQLTIPATATVVSDSSASGGKAVQFMATDAATGTLTTSGKSDTVTVVAKGVQCHGAPVLQLTVDSKAYTASVSSTSWQSYNIAAALVAGPHSVALNFTNPGGGKGKCSRQLTVDVIKAVDNSSTPPASDTTPPTVSLSSPVNGATVAGTVTISASASDNVGVSKVEFYQNGNLMSSVSASPYNYSWDTTTYPGGTYSLTAKAYDAAGNVGTTTNAVSVTVSNSSTTSSNPPAADGYFSTQAVGAWASLPSGSQCSQQVHYSTWEPRPENTPQNHTMPNTTSVHNSFASRPRSDGYNANWNSWLLPRVDGQFTGTTDEIIQWASCKWGIADNVLRGQAVRESTWYEGLHYSDGQCYWDRGCGDSFSSPTADSITYCNGIAAFGHDYQKDTNSTVGAYPWTPQAGMCPQTFSIIGVMSWDNPAWEAPNPAYPGNQNGTFPFSRDSTAFALDYEASYLRGCYEGWISWLPSQGDLWGCVGSWYSGDWHSTAANGYISRVQTEITNHTWLTTNFANGKGNQYQCDPAKGCPQ